MSHFSYLAVYILLEYTPVKSMRCTTTPVRRCNHATSEPPRNGPSGARSGETEAGGTRRARSSRRGAAAGRDGGLAEPVPPRSRPGRDGAGARSGRTRPALLRLLRLRARDRVQGVRGDLLRRTLRSRGRVPPALHL